MSENDSTSHENLCLGQQAVRTGQPTPHVPELHGRAPRGEPLVHTREAPVSGECRQRPEAGGDTGMDSPPAPAEGGPTQCHPFTGWALRDRWGVPDARNAT